MTLIRPEKSHTPKTKTQNLLARKNLPAKDDGTIIDETVKEIAKEYKDAAQNLMLKVGQIILKNIFENDTNAVNQISQKQSENIKTKLFHQLAAKIKELSKTGNTPSKTWLYNSVKLVIQEQKMIDCVGYADLSNSHKVELLSVKEESDKVYIVEQIKENQLSVRDTRQAVKETKQHREPGIPSLKRVIAKPHLAMSIELKNIKASSEYDIKTAKAEIATSKKRIEKEIDQKKHELQLLDLLEKDIEKYIHKK